MDCSDDFRGKLVVVGSAAQGNDLTDRGATPLEKDTLARQQTLERRQLRHHRPVHPPRLAADWNWR